MKQEEAERLIYEWQGRTIQKRGADTVGRKHKRGHLFYEVTFGSYLPISKEARIVDVPCGDGNILSFLQALGYTNVEGWDLDEGRIEVARELGLSASVKDAFATMQDMEPESVECIFSVDFFEHVDKGMAFDLLRLFKRVMTPSGQIIIRTPVTDSIYGSLHLNNDFTHRWAVNSGVWAAIAGANDLQCVDIVDERPRGTSMPALIKRVAFEIGRIPTLLQRRIMRGPLPRVWTPSVWIILKNLDSNHD